MNVEGSGICVVNCIFIYIFFLREFCRTFIPCTFEPEGSLERRLSLTFLIAMFFKIVTRLYWRTGFPQLFTDAKPVLGVQSVKRSAMVNGTKMTGRKNKGGLGRVT